MKAKKWVIIGLTAAIIVLALAIILTKNDNGKAVNPQNVAVEEIEIDESINGISVVSVDTIAGMYVEDGSNEVLSDILTVTFRNDSDTTLQYAKYVLTVGEEEYTFEISTVPTGGSVRAMEMNRKTLDGAKGEIGLREENIAWFLEEPSMCDNALKITEREGALVVENISGSTVKAPAYVYYKNFTDDTYIGGITYRSGTQQDLAPGETAVLNASHFDPEASKLMFVSYAP